MRQPPICSASIRRRIHRHLSAGLQRPKETNATRCAPQRANPNGIVFQSPRLPYSATLGLDSSRVQPRRGLGSVDLNNELQERAVVCNDDRSRNPFRVATKTDFTLHHRFQGSGVPQPWAERCNPLGVAGKTLCCETISHCA